MDQITYITCLGYRAVRIHAIFTLPTRLQQCFSQHLAYVEVFSPFSTTTPSVNLKQYTVTPLKRSNGIRTMSVIPLRDIKLGCHLTPHFQRMGDGDWKLEDLVGSFSHFYLNDFASDALYGYMHEWNTLNT
jgi:hypothetical protein